jgi:hypothetical protein
MVPEPTPTPSIPMTVNPGGPMLPPTDTSFATQPGGPFTPVSYSGAKGCTYTMSETVPYPCDDWNGIETHYPSTATSTAYVNCHGCQNVQVDKQLWFCGNQIVYGSTAVLTPTIITTTACATTTATHLTPVTAFTPPPHPTRPPTRSPFVARQNNLLEQQPDACPTTYVVQPSQSAGGTSTKYQQTVTETVRLPCGGCPLVLSTALFGPGPAGRFTATVTSPVGVSTTYACQ